MMLDVTYQLKIHFYSVKINFVTCHFQVYKW